MAKIGWGRSYHLRLSVAYSPSLFPVLSVRMVMVRSQRKQIPVGGVHMWTQGRTLPWRHGIQLVIVRQIYLVSVKEALCENCSEKIVSFSKMSWCICAWQGYPAYQCSLFAGVFPMQITVVSFLHIKIRLDIFSFEVLASNAGLFPYQSMCGKLRGLING